MDHSTQLENITENDMLFVATFSRDKGRRLVAAIIPLHFFTCVYILF